MNNISFQTIGLIFFYILVVAALAIPFLSTNENTPKVSITSKLFYILTCLFLGVCFFTDLILTDDGAYPPEKILQYNSVNDY